MLPFGEVFLVKIELHKSWRAFVLSYLYNKKNMASKKDVLNKIKILLTRRFKSDKDAINFFDKDSNLYLDKSEVAELLKEAGVSRWITSLAASQIIAKFDQDGNDQLDWQEFKTAIKALSKENNW